MKKQRDGMIKYRDGEEIETERWKMEIVKQTERDEEVLRNIRMRN